MNKAMELRILKRLKEGRELTHLQCVYMGTEYVSACSVRGFHPLTTCLPCIVSMGSLLGMPPEQNIKALYKYRERVRERLVTMFSE